MQVMAKITFSKLADDEVANITRIGASNNGQVARRKKLQGNEWFIPKEGKKYAGLQYLFHREEREPKVKGEIWMSNF